jgi:hypothetical protein
MEGSGCPKIYGSGLMNTVNTEYCDLVFSTLLLMLTSVEACKKAINLFWGRIKLKFRNQDTKL